MLPETINNRPIKKLWEIGTFIRWIAYHKQELLPSYVDWCVTLLRSNNIQNELNLNELQYLPKRLITEEKIVKKWDILFCMSNWSKDLVWKNIILPDLKDYSFGAFCSIFRPKTSESSIYIEYFLRSSFYKDYIYWLSRWIGINNLRNSDLEIFEIPLPPLDIQKAIVAKLDETFAQIDEAISTTQANIEKTNEFTKSVLNKVFEEGDWEKKPVKEIAYVKSWKRLPKWFLVQSEKTEYPYIRVSDFWEDWTIDSSNIKYITKQIFDQISKYIITDNDLYISIAGTIWKTWIIPSELNWANLTENAIRLIYKEPKNIDNKYILYFTKSSSFVEQAWIATRAVAMPKLAISRLEKIEIPLPPLAKQTEIVKYLDEVFAETSELKTQYQNKLIQLKELKASILQSAFEGKLI